MLKTKIGHLTVVDTEESAEESTRIIGITHGLEWENIVASAVLVQYKPVQALCLSLLK